MKLFSSTSQLDVIEEQETVYARRRTATTDFTTPSTTRPSRHYIARSISASRAQQQPLQRREGSHALPIINSPSPPDNISVIVDRSNRILPTKLLLESQQQKLLPLVPIIQQKTTLKLEVLTTHPTQQSTQSEQQIPNSNSRKTVASNTNVYSPGANYDSMKEPIETIKKYNVLNKGKNKDNTGVPLIPQYRPRSDPSTGHQPMQKPQQQHSKQQQQEQLQSSQKRTSPGLSLNIFGNMNPFKNFNSSVNNNNNNSNNNSNNNNNNASTKNKSAQLNFHSNIGPPQSPRLELIYSRPTRPSSSGGLFGLSTFGNNNIPSGSRSIDGLSSAAETAFNALQGQNQVPGQSQGSVLKISQPQPCRQSTAPGSESGMGVGIEIEAGIISETGRDSGKVLNMIGVPSPRFDDDLMFLNRTDIIRSSAVPHNSMSPSSPVSNISTKGRSKR